MRLYINELIKALCKKTTIGIFIVLTAINGILLWINDNRNNSVYTGQQYKAVYNDLNGCSPKQAAEIINNKIKKLSIFDLLSMGEDTSELMTELSDKQKQELIKEYNSDNYLEYTDNIYSEQELLNDIYDEVETSANYENYLNGIDKAADKMTGISIFAEPDTFSYKNIAKTPGDFAHLKGSELKIGPSKGISMSTDFLVTDLLGFLMIMSVVVIIVTREKELNQIILSRTTYKGRTGLGIAKLRTCFTCSIIIAVLLYAVNFSISYYKYSFGDLSRQLQSVSDFYGINLKISVIQFFVLFIFAKIAVYFVFSGLIYMITVILRSAVQVYGILLGVLSAEGILFYTIPETSYLCIFKYINIIAYANTNRIFLKYLNLNLFGNPINYIPVFFISVVFLIVAFSIISVVIFSKQKALKSNARKISISRLQLLKGKSVSIFLHECYKILIGGKVLFILLAFAALTIISYEPIKEKFSSADEIYYKQYMTQLKGEYNSDKQKFIDDEEKKFENLYNEMTASGSDSFLTILKYQDKLAPQEALKTVSKHAEYLKSTEKGEFLYDSGYKLLTGDESAGNKDMILALTAMAVTILCLVYVYSIEYQTGTNVLLHTSKSGRKQTFVSKFIISAAIVTIIYLLTYAPYFYSVLNAYGVQNINAPAYSMEHLSEINISIKSYLILISLLRYLALIIAILIIFFVSKKMKSLITSFLVSTAILVVPILLSLLGIKMFDVILLNPLLL